ncbi:LppU/SCO3897 family protein [Streptacidiphilus carbonis]|uniref:LppU/SCO3897 family protein n=1 Tax=Streptacidiphilus carbonis TaxID=105422 RepID=UPI000693886D|nr:hypothetical protein [Streptacidiphilus carbonis]
MSTPPSYGPQPGGGQYPGQAPNNPYAGAPAQQPNPYAGAPAQQQPNPYAGGPAQQQPDPYAKAPAQPQQPSPYAASQPGAPAGAPGQQQAYPAAPAQPYPNQQYPNQPNQAPAGGAPYAQQPQQGAGWQTPPPAKRSLASRFGGKLAIRLGVLVVLIIGGVVWSQFNGSPSTAKVGDCVQNKGTDTNPDVHVIKCSDPKAAYKVLKTSSGSDDSVCTGVAGTVVTFTETGSDNLVLCLGNNTP